MSVKRIFDILISACILLLLSPILLFVAIIVYFKMGKPVIYRQMRPGWKEKPFRICKFRTMLDLQDSSGRALADEERLVPLGRFLRSTSMDELPELWNVLIGDMSLVGPRPLLMQYLPLYNQEQRRRHDVRPGITGWAQIHGRNTLSWEDKFKLDVWYVDHRSFWLDLKILFVTAIKTFRREGIHAEGHATMPDFQGSTQNGK